METDIVLNRCLGKTPLSYEEAIYVLNLELSDILEHIPFSLVDEVESWAHLQKQRNLFNNLNINENRKLESISREDLKLIIEACGCLGKDEEPRDLDYGNYEGRMSKSKLFHIARMSVELYDMLHDDDDLPGWVNDKITTSEDRIGSAKKYIEYKLLTM